MSSSTLDDAAIAALFRVLLRKDKSREHMGALFASGEGFDQTDTISSGESSHVQGALTVPVKGSLRGLFHNHPGTEKSSEGFSPDDKAMARRLAVSSYISTPSGATKRFDPKTGKTEDVIAEFPIDEMRKYIMERLGRREGDPRGMNLTEEDLKSLVPTSGSHNVLVN